LQYSPGALHHPSPLYHLSFPLTSLPLPFLLLSIPYLSIPLLTTPILYRSIHPVLSTIGGALFLGEKAPSSAWVSLLLALVGTHKQPASLASLTSLASLASLATLASLASLASSWVKRYLQVHGCLFYLR
jgi:hypothetical protein